MAKKKTVKKKTGHVNKITPAVSINSGVLYDKLTAGQCFLMSGNLYMKETGNSQIGVNLATGKYVDYLCGRVVEPVEVTIAWKKK